MKENIRILGALAVMMTCSTASLASRFASISSDYESDPEEYTYKNRENVFEGEHFFYSAFYSEVQCQ